MEFHVSRKSREKYQFDEIMFSFDGNVIFADTHAVREFANRMNERNDLSIFPEKAVLASNIYAMGLIDEVFHYMIHLYRKQINPEIFESLYLTLETKLTKPVLDKVLIQFCEEFPTSEVYGKKIETINYLGETTNQQNNRMVVLEEVLLLWLSNINPAFMQYGELFDDTVLSHNSDYRNLITIAKGYFRNLPNFGPENLDLLSFLQKPAEVSPYSLSEQLEYIRNNWGYLLGDLLSRLLGSLDMIREESKMVFAGPGPAQIPDYSMLSRLIDLESERFSPDRDWMPSLVLMAKNAYVWMDQLSKKYGRHISILSEIPDQELDFLSGAGFTGLWLIGLWQRSRASERIKKLCGNPEAVASAYSIDSYRIADDLGGESAFQNLREKCWKRGIRLASDMVPNHMGIDSDWVIHRPEYFLSLDHCPFPSYSFNGENLSPSPDVGIHLEDHYYSRSDASVVFKRTDYLSGIEKYIYHGNDGTVMPWNDTAQLNYLNQNVREAVIQIILDVARRTPIIRFDAAMTLAKKHIQRLWFPEPGQGGAIPTRSDYGLSKYDFDRLIPEEFWREVVDRVASEVPDTLLLAEAFWLMEGFFVRTLGMHRVYNSAFMHMLRNEDNANFRKLIKNTLEFDPDILKRYVNFMNNPDEKTAVDQFGNGDKYFGVCTILSTLPGLPMFGHGQLEGYSEKYGMEYRKAYFDEEINTGLLDHHHRTIFPLLRKRSNYSEAKYFRLYDFFLEDGSIDENVYAYSNNGNNEKSLVLVNNRFSTTSGWVKTSVPYLNKQSGNNALTTESIAGALQITNDPDCFIIFKEKTKNLMFIRYSTEVFHQGLFFSLNPYEYRVYEEFFEVRDGTESHYRDICDKLAGNGVPDIFREIRRLTLLPTYSLLRRLISPTTIDQLGTYIDSNSPKDLNTFINKNTGDLQDLFHSIKLYGSGVLTFELFITNLVNNLKLVTTTFHKLSNGFGVSNSVSTEIAGSVFYQSGNTENLRALLLWVIFRSFLFKALGQNTDSKPNFYSELFLDEFSDQNNSSNPDQSVDKQFLWAIFSSTPTFNLSTSELIQKIINDSSLSQMLGINFTNNSLWFNQESMEKFIRIQTLMDTLCVFEQENFDSGRKIESAIRLLGRYKAILRAIPVSEYKVDKLVSLLQ